MASSCVVDDPTTVIRSCAGPWQVI